MHNNLRYKILLKNTLFTIAIPLAVLGVMEILCLAFVGVHVINSSVDAITLFRDALISFCFALGLNCNLALGRMDLSCGAQMYLSCILGGNIALSLFPAVSSAAQGVLVLAFSIVIGIVLGAIVGGLFISLRILPMILGFGVTLVFECISFNINDNQGLILYGSAALLSEPWFIFAVAFVISILVIILFQYTSFGFNRHAIQGNQKLANDSGINIYGNAVGCYVLAAALVAVAGVFITVYETRLVPVLGMSSNGYVFSNMFPMAVGVWLARKSNPVIGILFGSVAVQILIMGLGKFSIIGMSNYMQTCIRYFCWLIFMVYRMNENKLLSMKARKARIEMAKALSV